MKILLWHGYLLGGTGSNVYTRALAREWSLAGHDVTVVCQERHPESYDLAGAHVVRPELPGGILPVFVLDRYEGLSPALLQDLSHADREAFVDANAQKQVSTEIVAHFILDAAPIRVDGKDRQCSFFSMYSEGVIGSYTAKGRGPDSTLNIGLNFWLIPAYGMLGAAYATLAAYALLLLVRTWNAQKLYPVPYQWRRVGMVLVAAGVLTALGKLLPTSLPLAIGLTLVYPLSLGVLGFYSPLERARLRRLLPAHH